MTESRQYTRRSVLTAVATGLTAGCASDQCPPERAVGSIDSNRVLEVGSQVRHDRTGNWLIITITEIQPDAYSIRVRINDDYQSSTTVTAQAVPYEKAVVVNNFSVLGVKVDGGMKLYGDNFRDRLQETYDQYQSCQTES